MLAVARTLADSAPAFRSVLVATALAGVAAPMAGWAAPEPRVFTSIEVRGNERFRDGDIIATSGLQTGVPVSEEDILAAVEALDFTAEFENVRIYSEGETLIIVVDEEPAYSGGLGFGIGYDTDDGLVGAAYLDVENAFGGRATVAAELALGTEYQEFGAVVDSPSFYGGDRAGGIRLDIGNYEYDDTTFDYATAGLTPYLSFRRGDRFAAELRYTLANDDIYDVDDDTSPIIKAESGALVSSGIGFTLATGSDLDAADPAAPFRWSARLDQDLTGLGGDTTLSRTIVALTGRFGLGQSGFAIRGRASVGHVAGFDGDEPRVSDRFTLGGSRLRGFERSTVSPRDVCEDCAGVEEDTTLGGDSFAVLQADFILPFFQRYEGLETFVFGDVGSAWEVKTDTAPAGELIDDLEWRSSAGIGVSWETALGSFETYYALIVDAAEYDEVQHFGLIFRRRF